MQLQSLGNRLARAAPLLRGKGFTIDRRHSGESRTASIVPPAPARPGEGANRSD